MIRKSVLLCLSILLLGFGLRTWNLNSLPVFADESIYVRWSQVMKAESTLRFLPLSDGKQPLYMWALMPVFKVVSDPLVAGRMLSGGFDLITVVGVGILGWLLFKDKRIGVISSILWAVSPYSVFFSRMALVDSMLAGFIVWGYVFSLLAIRYQRFDWAMLSGFAFGFAWLTKSPAMIALIMVPSLLLLEFPKKNIKSWFLRSVLLLGTTGAIAFGMYNILRLGPEFHMIALRNKDYLHPLSEVLKHPMDPLKSHLRDAVQFFFYLLTPLGLLLSFGGIFAGGKYHWKPKLLLTVWWLAPIFLQGFMAKTFTARYLLYTVPFSIILAAYTAEYLGQHTKKYFLTYVAVGIVVASSLVYNFFLLTNPQVLPMARIERAGYLEEWTAGQGIREVSEYIRERAKTGNVIVGSEGYFGTPFDGLQLYLNDVKNVRIVGAGVWIDSVSENLTNALDDNQVFLVVNSSRFHAKPEDLGINLIASYPKAINPTNGFQEYLLFFEVPKSLKK